jgi:hypothetical protein
MPTVPKGFEDLAAEFGHVPLAITGIETTKVMRLRIAFDRSEAEGTAAAVLLMNDALQSEEQDAMERAVAALWNVCYQKNSGAPADAHEQCVRVLKTFFIQSESHINLQGRVLQALRGATPSLFVSGAVEAMSVLVLQKRLGSLADSGGLDVKHEAKSRLLQTEIRGKLTGAVKPNQRAITNVDHRDQAQAQAIPLTLGEGEREKLDALQIPTSSSLLAHQIFQNGKGVNVERLTDYAARAAEHAGLSSFLRLCMQSVAFMMEQRMVKAEQVQGLLAEMMKVVIEQHGDMAKSIFLGLQQSSELLRAAEERRATADKETAHDTAAKAPDTHPDLPTISVVVAKDASEKKEDKIPQDFLKRLGIKLAEGEAKRLEGNLARCKALSRILLSGALNADDGAVRDGYKSLSITYHSDNCPGDYGKTIYVFIQLMNEILGDGGEVSKFLPMWKEARDAARYLLKQREAEGFLKGADSKGGAPGPSGALLDSEQSDRATSMLYEARKHPENAMRHVINVLELVVKAMSPGE